jgi:hypothetical protein
VVEAIAVQRHGEPALGPAAVDVVRADRAVRPRQGKSLLAHELQEAPLQRTERDARVTAQDLAELRHAGSPRPAFEDRGDVRGRRAVADAGLVARSGELIEGEVGGEVDERARHGRDRNAAVVRAIPPLDAAPPHPDPSHTALQRRGHLRRRGRAVEEPEQVRRRPAAQPRFVAAGEHGGEVARLDARRAVADAVDPGMNPEQCPAVQTVLDLMPREAGPLQLRPRDHPMLSRRKLRE